MEETVYAGWNILIVDDEPDNVGVISCLLSFHNIPFRTADDGAAGLKLIREQRPTVVLLDIAMPNMSGWDVIKTIREDPELKDIVVMALTAYAMEGDRERVMGAGFDAYISKPISILAVMDNIQDAVRTRRERLMREIEKEAKLAMSAINV